MTNIESLPRRSTKMKKPQTADQIAKKLKTAVDIAGHPDIPEEEQREFFYTLGLIRKNRALINEKIKSQPAWMRAIPGFVVATLIMRVKDVWFTLELDKTGRIQYIASLGPHGHPAVMRHVAGVRTGVYDEPNDEERRAQIQEARDWERENGITL